MELELIKPQKWAKEEIRNEMKVALLITRGSIRSYAFRTFRRFGRWRFITSNAEYNHINRMTSNYSPINKFSLSSLVMLDL